MSLTLQEAKGMGDTKPCACGCGGLLKEYDNWKRKRVYLSGHNIKAALAAYLEHLKTH